MLGRLRKSEDFARVRKSGAHWRGRLCAVSVCPRARLATSEADAAPRQTASRVGFITSKKVGNAVKRNRARRLMSEAARALAEELPLNYDIVIVALPALAAPGTKMQHARDELRNLLAKLSAPEAPSAQSQKI